MTGASKPETGSARCLAAWLAAMFLVILGAKLWVIRLYGTDLPFWDQWDEAANVFKPWLAGHLTWGGLFAPHNEHRIFFTRVLDLFEIRLNGRWDPIFQAVVSAMIHSLYACGLAFCLWLLAGKKHQGLICLLVTPFFALPFAGENILHGFQSQMYFLGIFSLLTIVGLGLQKPGSAGWWCGLAAAVMALFTMGSGLLAALAVVGLMVLRTLRSRRFAPGLLLTAVCGLAVFAVGLSLNVTPPEDRQYRAQSISFFIDSLMRNLAWPFWNLEPMFLLVCLPLVLVCVRYLQSNLKNPRAAEFVLTFGFWGFLQAAGLAFSRSGLGDSSRYLDTLSIVPLAGAAGWLVLVEEWSFRPWPRLAMVIAWAGVILFGLGLNTEKSLTGYLPDSRKWGVIEENNVRAFMRSNDPACLAGTPRLAIPYNNAARLAELLRDRDLQTIMPPACQPPPSGASSSAVGERRQMGWFGLCARKLLDCGVVVLGAGLCLMAFLFCWKLTPWHIKDKS